MHKNSSKKVRPKKPASAQDFMRDKNLQWKKELSLDKTRGFKDIGREGSHHFRREAWTFMPQHNINEKVFVIERLRRIKIAGKAVHKDVGIGDVEYRFGYYIVGKIGNKNGRWTWGQYCPLIPVKDFSKLIKKAQREGTILK